MLSELGLTGYEEKCYRALLAGASTPKEISQQSGVPPTAVYPAVDGLVHKDLIQEISGKTKCYEALDPKIGIKRLVRKQRKKLEEAEEQLIEELQYTPAQTEKSPIQLSRGTQSSITHSYDMMLGAKKSFYIMGWNFNRPKSVAPITRKLKRLQNQGIEIKILFTYKTVAGDLFRKNLDQLGIPYRFIKTGYISLVIADGQKCKITLKRKDLSERVNMVVEDPNLAQAMQQYYLTLWKKGKKDL